MIAPAVPTPKKESPSEEEYNLTTRQVNDSPAAVPKPEMIETELPLETPWTLYMFAKSTNPSDNWISGMKNVVTVKTVQEFWGVMNNLKSLMKIRVDLYFFRSDITPMWEDEANCNGGRIRFTINKKMYNLDDVWTELTLAAVGEHFPPEEINGIDINCRRGKFSIWTRGQENVEECNDVIKNCLFYANIEEETELVFSNH